MVDISDLGGSGKKNPFPGFEKSAVDRLAEATKSPFDDLDFGMKTMREGLSAVDKLGRASLQTSAMDKSLREALYGTVDRLGSASHQASAIDKSLREALGGTVDRLGSASLQASTMDKSLREALGGSLGSYYKSRDHMRDVFGSKSLADEVDKLIKGPSAGSEIDNYMAGFERRTDERSFPDLPPMPYIPPNPIHETNEHLEGLVERIDALVDLQAKQAEVIDKLLQVQIANDAAQDRATKRSYRLGVVNAVLATILGIGAIVATVIIAG